MQQYRQAKAAHCVPAKVHHRVRTEGKPDIIGVRTVTIEQLQPVVAGSGGPDAGTCAAIAPQVAGT